MEKLEYVIVYLEDLFIIASSSLNENITYVEEVMKRLQ